jgi:hypothetical protein
MLDTCVWWNLLTDHKEKTILTVLKELVDTGEVRLIIPDVVKNEIKRNKENIRNNQAKTYKTHLKNAKDLLRIFDIEREEITLILDEISVKVDEMPDEIETNLKIAEFLFRNKDTVNIKISESVKSNSIQRGLDKRAPFHKSRNSVADAVIAEEFKLSAQNLLGSEASWIAFITFNKSDFSDPKNPRCPHTDLHDCFKFDPRISYSINVAQLINEIKDGTIPNEVVQHVDRHPGYRELFCEDGEAHDFKDVGWLRAPYGGMSWHLRCKRCGLLYDTGELLDA